MIVKGIPVSTPMLRPDWNQDNPLKSDYIKNKPDLKTLNDHTIDKDNPHGVTAEQIGALMKEAVYTATSKTLLDVVSKAQPNSTIYLEAGDYPLLTFTGEYGLARAETDNPLQGLVMKYPENLTVVGGEGVTVAGISITSGIKHPDQYVTTDKLRNELPGRLTLKNLNLSNSVCLRNCTLDGLNILDCYFAAGANILINPNTYTDKFGRDTDSTSSTVSYTNNAATYVSNVVIRGNTIEDASESANDTKTRAICVYSVNNVTIHNNTINKSPHDGIQIRSISESYSTGKIGIVDNVIKNTGCSSIHLINIRNANVFVCSNELHDANLIEPSLENLIHVTNSYGSTYTWKMAETGSGSNSYRENKKVVIQKLTVGDGIMLDNVNPEPVNAAPAGYGLGEAAKKPAGSFDDVMGGAFIEAGLGAAHANSSWAGINVTFGNEFNHGYQEAVDVLNHPNVKARRTRLNRKWNAWEYENPPMNPGVEYRTTERSEGKPVYAKRISYTPGTTLGKVGASTDTSIAHGIANFNYLVRCSGRHATYPLPELTMTNGTVSINQVGTSAIVLRHINAVTSATTWYFDLYYTKTTD